MVTPRSFRLILLLLLAITTIVFAQEPRDTTLRLLLTPPPDSFFTHPVIVVPFSVILEQQETGPVMPFSSVLAGVPKSFAWERRSTIDLTAPLKLQLRESESDRPWKISLGAAQAAGTAYILYRHLKKYGFY